MAHIRSSTENACVPGDASCCVATAWLILEHGNEGTDNPFARGSLSLKSCLTKRGRIAGASEPDIDRTRRPTRTTLATRLPIRIATRRGLGSGRDVRSAPAREVSRRFRLGNAPKAAAIPLGGWNGTHVADLVGDCSRLSEHERDAYLAAFSAREGFSGRFERDLSLARSPSEQGPNSYWLARVYYFWPLIPNEHMVKAVAGDGRSVGVSDFDIIQHLLAQDACPTDIAEAARVSRQASRYRVQDDPAKTEAMRAEWGM
jgi:hypothetical protein